MAGAAESELIWAFAAKVRKVGKTKVSYTEDVAASIRATIRKLGLA